jgi:hypothetical protein
MIKPIPNPYVFLLFVFSLTFLISCSRIIAPPERADISVIADPEALRLLDLLKTSQKESFRFKAIGKITIENTEVLQVSRAAWAVDYPHKFRLEFLTPAGQPAATVSADDNWLYVLSHNKNRLVQKPKSEYHLEKLLSISINAEDIVFLLAGKIPFEGSIQSAGATTAPELSYEVLALDRGNRGGITLIYFDKQTRHAFRMENFDAAGILKFRADFEEFVVVDDRLAPKRIRLVQPAGGTLAVSVERYWPDVMFEPGLFVLTPP